MLPLRGRHPSNIHIHGFRRASPVATARGPVGAGHPRSSDYIRVYPWFF